MNNSFFGFRGNISFPNQVSIYNFDLQNNSTSKNKIFRDFFNMIETKKMFESKYQKRIYYLIFKNKYNDILHCQLARKKQINRRELIEKDIIDTEDEDYPYVNIFVELESQKFLIESNTQVFDNYNTCSNVLENIINSNLKEKEIRINLNPIIEENDFWKYFYPGAKIYNIHFKLIAPNSFDAEDSASNFINAAQDDVGANIVNVDFCNSDGNLNPNKKGIGSFINYISNGGGDWKISVISSNGKKETISSKQKSVKVNVPISYDELKSQNLTVEQLYEITNCFSKIEKTVKFRRNK